MAQREKEDTELHVPETIVLCANNCGFSGNPATNNMCQACFQASAASSPPNPTSCSPRSAPIRTPELATEASKEAPKEERSQKAVAVAVAAAAASEAAPSKSVNRCFGCRKRVRLAGFRCRCGELFCGEHRYSDRHDCGFDYKTAAQSAIARQNPVVRAAKIIRI